MVSKREALKMKAFLYLSFIVLVLYFTAAGDVFSQSKRACFLNIKQVVEQYVEIEFSRTYGKYSHNILAVNDILCEELEDMANIAILVIISPEESYFGIFHIHFLIDGTFKSAESFQDVLWTKPKNNNEWKILWCELIMYVYEEELEEQGCQ